MSQFQILGRGPPPFKAISNLSAYTNIFDAIHNLGFRYPK